MAYLKTHFPAEFMAARLAAWGGFYSPRVYMSEARRLGLTVKPPHVNHSGEAFTLEPPGTLWMGLGQVRDLTHATLQAILEQRPFASLEDLLARTQPQHVEAVNLVKAGALEGLGNAHALLASLEHTPWRGRHAAQLGLAWATPSALPPEPTAHDRAAWERETLGMLVSVHPLHLVAEELSRYALTRSDQLSAHAGQDVTLAGVRLAAHRFSDKHGEPMLLVDMEDEARIYQVWWSGPALKEYSGVLARQEPMIIRGRVRGDRQGHALVVGVEAVAV
jgi:DNA polymerase III alpha subunit